MNEGWSIYTRDREDEKQRVYVPIPCRHAGSDYYSDVCKGTVEYGRRQFTVCGGCADSYLTAVRYCTMGKRLTFDESLEVHRYFMRHAA